MWYSNIEHKKEISKKNIASRSKYRSSLIEILTCTSAALHYLSSVTAPATGLGSQDTKNKIFKAPLARNTQWLLME